MAKIAVYDVAADSGGALSILDSYYHKAIKDKTNTYAFIVSQKRYKNTDNVAVLEYPWVKKGWVHRIIFDLFFIRSIIKKHHVDELLSLQNIIIPFLNIPQKVYMHQSLPFAERRYGIIENPKFWFYQNIVSQLIYCSLKHSSHIIVQTHWLAHSIEEKLGIPKSKITIEPPELPEGLVRNSYKRPKGKVRFIYPAAPYEYKNHMLVVDALREMPKSVLVKMEITFTFNGDENKLAEKIKRIAVAENLPIVFKPMTQGALLKRYQSSVLLFPSILESYGLPLAESRAVGAPIIASDTEFSHELMLGYKSCHFIKNNNIGRLKEIISESVK